MWQYVLEFNIRDMGYPITEYGVGLLRITDFNPGLHYIFLARHQYCVIFLSIENVFHLLTH